MVGGQYPYTLHVMSAADSVYDEATGEYITTPATELLLGACRDEVNGTGAKLTTQDGEVYTFNAIIYAPKSIQDISNGTQVIVKDGDKVRLIANVVQIHKNRLHTRIWV